MLDEELLLHRLCQCPRRAWSKHDWITYYGPIQQRLLTWLNNRHAKGKLKQLDSPPPQMQSRWPYWQVPALETLPQLANFLGLTLQQLEGLADRHEIQHYIPLGPRHHYRYRWVNSRRGRHRLLEIPKLRLKTVQAKILHGILDNVPPHEVAHGFRRNHSIFTNAEPHVKQEVVVSYDLADFFATVRCEQVMAIFRRIGYPRIIARHLAAICTKSTPEEVWRKHPSYASQPAQWQRMGVWRRRHLPQGAPTSPALANLAAWRLDMRMSHLARHFQWTFTRYADDLTFSGDRALGRNRLTLMTWVAGIVGQEGFRINLKKTHLMRQSQRQEVCGVVVNQKCNVRRSEYDELKAILHNCVKHGGASHNRRQHPDFAGHLRGRIAALAQINSLRAAKLFALWEGIKW